MKKLACAIAILACLLAAAYWLLQKRLEGGVAAAGLRLGAPVELVLWPPALGLADVAWQGQIAGVAAKASAKSARAGLDPSSLLPALLYGELALRELEVDQPLIELRGSPAPRRGAEAMRYNFPPIGRLSTHAGELRWLAPDFSLRLSGLRLALANLRPGEEADAQCDFALDLRGPAELAGNVALRAKLRSYAPNLLIRAGQATFTSTAAGSEAAPAPWHAQFEGSWNIAAGSARLRAASISRAGMAAKFSGEWAQGALNGDAEATFAGLPLAGALALSGPFSIEAGRVSLPAAQISFPVGKGEASLEAALPNAGAPLAIIGEVALGWIDPAQLPWAAPGPGVLAPGWPDLNLKIAAKGIRARAFVVERPALALAGSAGEYEISDFGCHWAGGIIQGAAEIDLAGKKFGLNLAGENISLGSALAQFGFEGFRRGPASLSLRLEGCGADWDAAARGISGSGELSYNDLELEPLSELGLLLPLAGRLARPLAGAHGAGRVKLEADAGILRIRPELSAGAGLSADGSLVLDLGQNYLKGALMIHIGGAAIPIAVAGPPADPEWSIDSGAGSQ